MDMLQKNFKRCYKLGRDLSIDESCCPFKGRLKFWCYNPRKPAKFHIKMFEVSDSKTGYVVGFDVYTGKNKTDSYKTAKTLDQKCTPTTKPVVGLLQSCNLVGKGIMSISITINILLWHSSLSKKEFTTSSDQGQAQEQG